VSEFRHPADPQNGSIDAARNRALDTAVVERDVRSPRRANGSRHCGVADSRGPVGPISE
jgi:hypothetical protein